MYIKYNHINLFILAIVTGLFFTQNIKAQSQKIDILTDSAEKDLYIINFTTPSVSKHISSKSNLVDSIKNLQSPKKQDNKINRYPNEVKKYKKSLEKQQSNFIAKVIQKLNRDIVPTYRYYYALNGMAIKLGANEAKLISELDEISSITKDYLFERPDLGSNNPRNHMRLKTVDDSSAIGNMQSFAASRLIGAENIWNGQNPSLKPAFGEGQVIAIIGDGITYDHPAFSELTDSGYMHENPLGEDNFLGICDPKNIEQFISESFCNDKLIGSYFFPEQETVNEDGLNAATIFGSVTSGNLKSIDSLFGIESIEASGVARYSNLIVFDICVEGCSGANFIRALEQIISDGVVDVITLSVQPGVPVSDAWTDPISRAMLEAFNSGIFITESINSTDGNITNRPWSSVLGVSTHTHKLETLLSVTPSRSGKSLNDIQYTLGQGPFFSESISSTIKYSGNIDIDNVVGCEPFPEASFNESVALILRGVCRFEDKINNAYDAGAVAVIIQNNVEGGATGLAGVDSTLIPSISITQDDGQAIVDLLAESEGTVVINNPAYVLTRPDVISENSVRGPDNTELLSPMMVAPGSDIVTATKPEGAESYEYTFHGPSFGIVAGSFNAGAAALIRELHPSWSPSEINSALMLTASTTNLLNEGDESAATPFDSGAGRIQVDLAAATGLVMTETRAGFESANPNIGGDPKALNIAAYRNNACIDSCIFERTFTSVAKNPVEYSVELINVFGNLNADSFSVNPGETVTVTVEIIGTNAKEGEFGFGSLKLVPNSKQHPILSMPISVSGSFTDFDLIFENGFE